MNQNPQLINLNLGLDHLDSDIKRPWEMARFQSSSRIALSFYSADVQLIDECFDHFIELIDDFHENNPVGYGVNWVNAMEVAIRMINILVASDVYHHLGKTIPKRVTRCISLHLKFILENLERKDGLGNNHYLANLLGLLFGLVYFPDWPEFQQRKKWIVKQFEIEIQKQFYKDGGNFEGSTYYHSLSTEISIWGMACLRRLNINVEMTTLDTIQRACSFLEAITKPNGDIPQFGDNDSGSIFNFLPRGEWMSPDALKKQYLNLNHWNCEDSPIYHENVLNVEKVMNLFKESTGKRNSLEYQVISTLSKDKEFFPNPTQIFPFRQEGDINSYSNENIWLIQFEEFDQAELISYYFPDTGLAIIKNASFYLCISLLNRSKAHRYRGHFHNDQLSIELWVNNKNVIVDPGTNTYTGNMLERNQMRSARAHNAPYFGVEPNPFMPGIMGLFHSMNKSKTVLHSLNSEGLIAELKFGKIKVLRKIKINANHLEVRDSSNYPFTINHGKHYMMSDGYGRKLKV
jgi:hypothetical protein